MKKIILVILILAMLVTPVFASELHLFTNPDAELETISFEVPSGVPSTWYPLRAASEYLPIAVDWNEETRKVVVFSEAVDKVNKFTSTREYAQSEDLIIINGVSYVSPKFLNRVLFGVGFEADDTVYCSKKESGFDAYVDAALLELKVKMPDGYDLVTTYLTGGVKLGYMEDAVSYVYPYDNKPVCYITDPCCNGMNLAAAIAHEAYHVYQAKNGLEISETNAKAYEDKVYDTLRDNKEFYYIYKHVD